MRGLSAVSPALQLALGRTIRERREALHMTQEALAARIGMNRERVGRAEAGRHALMLGTIELFARGLEMKASELLAEAEALSARTESRTKTSRAPTARCTSLDCCPSTACTCDWTVAAVEAAE